MSEYSQAGVERIARALYNETRSVDSLGWSKLSDELRAHWFAFVIAALDMATGAREHIAGEGDA